MISIDHVLISDAVVEEQFVCDLSRCKGACCVDGDAGAPVSLAELKEIDRAFDIVLPHLTPEARKVIEEDGRYVYHPEFGWVTPTIDSRICVYGLTGPDGTVHCSFEQAYQRGEISWKKPISCHLFPLIVTQSQDGITDLVNYEPREDHCRAACSLGKKLKVPVYAFLREALVRRFGQPFYDALEATAAYMRQKKKS